MALRSHPFYVATLFVPQIRSTLENPHPLIRGFIGIISRSDIN